MQKGSYGNEERVLFYSRVHRWRHVRMCFLRCYLEGIGVKTTNLTLEGRRTKGWM